MGRRALLAGDGQYLQARDGVVLLRRNSRSAACAPTFRSGSNRCLAATATSIRCGLPIRIGRPQETARQSGRSSTTSSSILCAGRHENDDILRHPHPPGTRATRHGYLVTEGQRARAHDRAGAHGRAGRASSAFRGARRVRGDRSSARGPLQVSALAGFDDRDAAEFRGGRRCWASIMWRFSMRLGFTREDLQRLHAAGVI